MPDCTYRELFYFVESLSIYSQSVRDPHRHFQIIAIFRSDIDHFVRIESIDIDRNVDRNRNTTIVDRNAIRVPIDRQVYDRHDVAIERAVWVENNTNPNSCNICFRKINK